MMLRGTSLSVIAAHLPVNVIATQNGIMGINLSRGGGGCFMCLCVLCSIGFVCVFMSYWLCLCVLSVIFGAIMFIIWCVCML